MAKGSNQIIHPAAAGVASVFVLLSSPHMLLAGSSQNVGAQNSFAAQLVAQAAPAPTMQALLQQEVQDAEATAVNVLRSYERLTATHAEAMSKLVPIFETLYISLSEDQKKVADKIFQPIE